ncbi:MAG: transcriptional repressor [Paludibacteraceae bacterium]|nr:transcriptional repressor [Paludibacteraceae bacterium]MBQ6764660.1 transcriptional repressor [Paludibacteraceae bacterium]
MKTDKTYKSALERLSGYIRANGMRPSAVRRMILEQVCALPQPFTAEQLAKACAEQRISVGSVYNALNLFVTARLLHASVRQRGRAATEYELMTDNTVRMQVICQKCGRTTDFNDKAIARLIQERKYSNFNLQHFSLFVYGECKVCRRRVAKATLNS